MKISEKTSASLLLTLLMAIGLNSVSAQNFEGVIYYEIPEMTAQGMGEMPYMVKGDRVRMEFGEGAQGGALIYMPDSNQMAFILEAMKGYMTLDVDDPKTSAQNSEENTQMEKTGDTKTIAGRTCEVWQATYETNTYQMCVAKGLGNFMMPKNPMAQSNTPQWAKEAMADGFMPLEVVEISGSSNSTKMRATRIEEKSLSDDLFQVPEGYNDMSSMMKQMMNRGNN